MEKKAVRNVAIVAVVAVAAWYFFIRTPKHA